MLYFTLTFFLTEGQWDSEQGKMTTIRQKKGKHRLECTGECVRERSERINNLGVVVWITSEIGHVVTDGNQSVTLLRFSNLAFSSLTFTTFESAYAPRSEAGTCRRRASPKHELKPPKKNPTSTKPIWMVIYSNVNHACVVTSITYKLFVLIFARAPLAQIACLTTPQWNLSEESARENVF